MLFAKWCIYSTSKLDCANLWNLDPWPSDSTRYPKIFEVTVKSKCHPTHFCVKLNHPAYSVRYLPESKRPLFFLMIIVFFFFFVYVYSHTFSLPHHETVLQINGACGYGDGQFSWASVLKAGDFIRESKHSLAVDIWEPQRFSSVIFLWRTFTLMQNNTWGDFLIIWLKKSPLYKVPSPFKPQIENRLPL